MPTKEGFLLCCLAAARLDLGNASLTLPSTGLIAQEALFQRPFALSSSFMKFRFGL